MKLQMKKSFILLAEETSICKIFLVGACNGLGVSAPHHRKALLY
jgi:hypothetical protein